MRIIVIIIYYYYYINYSIPREIQVQHMLVLLTHIPFQSHWCHQSELHCEKTNPSTVGPMPFHKCHRSIKAFQRETLHDSQIRFL